MLNASGFPAATTSAVPHTAAGSWPVSPPCLGVAFRRIVRGPAITAGHVRTAASPVTATSSTANGVVWPLPLLGWQKPRPPVIALPCAVVRSTSTRLTAIVFNLKSTPDRSSPAAIVIGTADFALRESGWRARCTTGAGPVGGDQRALERKRMNRIDHLAARGKPEQPVLASAVRPGAERRRHRYDAAELVEAALDRDQHTMVGAPTPSTTVPEMTPPV